MTASRRTRTRSRLRRVIASCLIEQRTALVLALIALAGMVIADVMAPWPLKIIFDHILLAKPLPDALAALQPVLDMGPWPALMLSALAIATIAATGGMLAYVQLSSSVKVGYRISWRLRAELFAHVQRLSLSYHRGSSSGELLTKVAGDTNILRDMFSDWMLTLLRHLTTLIAMLTVMYWLNWRLALVVTASLPPLLGVIFLLNRRVKASVREQRKTEGAMVSRLNEVLRSIVLVQAYGRHAYEEERFRREIDANYHSGIRSTRSSAAIVAAIAILCATGTAVTVLLGAREVLGGQLSPGELLIFVTYVTSLYKPVRDLGRLSAKFSRAGVSLQRVGDVLDLETEVDAPFALELTSPRGEIVFEDVSFEYEPGRVVIEHLDLTIRAGERVALVGPSGAGKSTLVCLLLRLYEPTRGRILLDGVDIRRYTRESLRRHIGMVLQENLLFSGSVRENIAYGALDANEEQIESAARAARAHEFIEALPDGYDTDLGEGGAALSGGQRQRLCLARAFVKRPAILLMDEPTASVDPVSARWIHRAVGEMHRGRTLILIAHDLSDLSEFDRVLVLDAGRINEMPASSIPPQARVSHLSLVEQRHA